jgi:3-hydroxyisobutyrate dehydrogenase
MNIGYVGLGNMGGPLAARLQRFQPLFVYDLKSENIQSLVKLGATACASNRAIGEKCDVVLLCLQTSAQVREAIFGNAGLIDGLKPGSMIIDQTTGDPYDTRAIASQLEERGIILIDGPVSGGPARAAAGTISIMVGATDAQFARVEPILRMISTNVFHLGALGSGHVIKIINNFLNCAQRLMSFEAMCLAAKSGIEPRKALDALAVSSGRNNLLMETFYTHILNGKLSAGFTLGLQYKDVKLCQELAMSVGVPTFFTGTVLSLVKAAANEFGPEAENNFSVKLFERMSGVKITGEGPMT